MSDGKDSFLYSVNVTYFNSTGDVREDIVSICSTQDDNEVDSCLSDFTVGSSFSCLFVDLSEDVCADSRTDPCVMERRDAYAHLLASLRTLPMVIFFLYILQFCGLALCWHFLFRLARTYRPYYTIADFLMGPDTKEFEHHSVVLHESLEDRFVDMLSRTPHLPMDILQVEQEFEMERSAIASDQPTDSDNDNEGEDKQFHGNNGVKLCGNGDNNEIVLHVESPQWSLKIQHVLEIVLLAVFPPLSLYVSMVIAGGYIWGLNSLLFYLLFAAPLLFIAFLFLEISLMHLTQTHVVTTHRLVTLSHTYIHTASQSVYLNALRRHSSPNGYDTLFRLTNDGIQTLHFQFGVPGQGKCDALGWYGLSRVSHLLEMIHANVKTLEADPIGQLPRARPGEMTMEVEDMHEESQPTGHSHSHSQERRRDRGNSVQSAVTEPAEFSRGGRMVGVAGDELSLSLRSTSDNVNYSSQGEREDRGRTESTSDGEGYASSMHSQGGGGMLGKGKVD